MSLPATRFPLPHVGTARNLGLNPSACADPKVGCLLSGSQLEHRTARTNKRPIFNAATFRLFFRRLLRQHTLGRRMVVVLDNARYHHARLLADFLHRHDRQLRLLCLPPYSPQLPQIDRVWRLARRLATHNRYFPLCQLAEVMKTVSACFDRWRKPNKLLHRLCCIT